MATKRDYEFTARMLRVWIHDPHQRLAMALDFADYFKTQNSQFDRDRFVDAVKLPSDRRHTCQDCVEMTELGRPPAFHTDPRWGMKE